MPFILLGFISAGMLAAFGGPDPTDRSTNKPSEAACAAARGQGQSLPGCTQAPAPPEGEVDSAAEPGGVPRDNFIVCPGDRRCPR